MNNPEVVAALPTAIYQFAENLEKAANEIQKAQQAWNHAENDPVAQAQFQELRELFAPQTINGVVYEKRWSLPAFLEWLDSELYISNALKNPTEVLTNSVNELLSQLNTGNLKMSADDLAVCKIAAKSCPLQSGRDLFAKLIAHGEKCLTLQS